MLLLWCGNCEHFHGRDIEIPNKETGIADVYCEECLPEKYKAAFQKFKETEVETEGACDG